VKLGIMQPYFFPYLGYFALIAHTERWIVFDITQYTPKSWMNRNRVLHPQHGWNYITAPLLHSSISLVTREARVQNVAATAMSLLGKLSHYRKQAPYYRAVVRVVEESFAAADSDSLVHVNVNGLAAVCRYLDIPFDYRICSELGLPLPASMEPGGWAPAICEQLGATGYLNPPGGRALFEPRDFVDAGVTLEFLQVPEIVYPTGTYAFEADLSILDVMMWNSPAAINDLIQNRFELQRVEPERQRRVGFGAAAADAPGGGP
jgi:hypothetical protein